MKAHIVATNSMWLLLAVYATTQNVIAILALTLFYWAFVGLVKMIAKGERAQNWKRYASVLVWMPLGFALVIIGALSLEMMISSNILYVTLVVLVLSFGTLCILASYEQSVSDASFISENEKSNRLWVVTIVTEVIIVGFTFTPSVEIAVLLAAIGAAVTMLSDIYLLR